MQSAVDAPISFDEHYVVRIDGRVESHHRRFVDALREALRLKGQFPQQDVKVRANEEQR